MNRKRLGFSQETRPRLPANQETWDAPFDDTNASIMPVGKCQRIIAATGLKILTAKGISRKTDESLTRGETNCKCGKALPVHLCDTGQNLVATSSRKNNGRTQKERKKNVFQAAIEKYGIESKSEDGITYLKKKNMDKLLQRVLSHYNEL